jgi:hypothetical protein
MTSRSTWTLISTLVTAARNQWVKPTTQEGVHIRAWMIWPTSLIILMIGSKSHCLQQMFIIMIPKMKKMSLISLIFKEIAPIQKLPWTMQTFIKDLDKILTNKMKSLTMNSSRMISWKILIQRTLSSMTNSKTWVTTMTVLTPWTKALLKILKILAKVNKKKSITC